MPTVEQATAERRRVLTDRGAIVIAALAAAGAWWHHPAPLALGGILAVTALALRRPWVLGLAVLLLAGELGNRAMDGLTPIEAGRHDGPVTLVADPIDTRFGVRVDVKVGSRRVELTATGAPAGTVRRAAAGERLLVTGRLEPPPPDAPWLVPRHVVGRLAIDRVEPLDAGSWPWRAANRLRGLLVDGAAPMPATTRSLYGGFVLGDDRDQPPEVVDDFRATGLTHLLVVSGQNVAFVMVLAAPLLRRLGLGWRWLATLWVIASFALVTRFEPSVLRASAMAAVAVTATLTGRPAGTVRVLALAVTGLLLVDPLLVRSVAFQLSVGASLGIAWWSVPIADRLRGPTWWREALAVTLAAQAGVAPILLPRFGGMPVVSLPANLLAVPVSGLVTTWGLPAGIVAGICGGRVAEVLHLPTELLIGWVAGVARVAARLPLGELGVGEAVVLAVLAVGATSLHRWWPSRRWRRPASVVLAIAAALIVLGPAWRLRSPPDAVALPGGHRVIRTGGATIVVIGGRAWADDLLEGLRLAGVRRIDLLVAPKPLGSTVDRALRHRWPIARVVVADPVPPRMTVDGRTVTLDATQARGPAPG